MGLTFSYDNALPLIFKELRLDDLSPAIQAQIQQIDDILPQTQCGLCGHADGCLPYAHAIVTQDTAINLCVPGGNAVSLAISRLTSRPYLPAMTSAWQINPDTHRPQEVRAIINEQECIGCTKCIPACPVDAIVGTAKHMHSILSNLCTGCELCLPPCPVDCIRLVPIERTLDDHERQAEQLSLKTRYHHHLRRAEQQATSHSPTVSVMQSKIQNALQSATPTDSTIDEATAKNTIAAAKLRSQLKKLHRQLASSQGERHSKLSQQIQALEQALSAL
ncbi:MAG: RnfABCDGE type electron transport complex subunit B [Moraxella sp.]|nr:RnfABCDGE type electron transport complex subunit B [Moraxella sp.]